MAAQDASTTVETASSPLPAQDDETITTNLVREDVSGGGRAEDSTARENEDEDAQRDARPAPAETNRDEQRTKDVAAEAVESETQADQGSHAAEDPEQTSLITSESTLHDPQLDTSTTLASPRKEESALTSLSDGHRDTDPAPSSNTLKPNPIQASSTINRTSSPAYSQSSVTSTQGKDSVASPSLVSTAPKKFSTVNINKKFLGKTGTAGSAAPPTSGSTGHKDNGLGLVNLSGTLGNPYCNL
jgi:hypothetical protein